MLVEVLSVLALNSNKKWFVVQGFIKLKALVLLAVIMNHVGGLLIRLLCLMTERSSHKIRLSEWGVLIVTLSA